MWSKLHLITLLPALVVFGLLAWLIGYLLRNKSEKIRMIPIQIIAIILIVLEIIKQAYCIIDGYDLYAIPLHFCSLFLYLFPAMAFYNGKHKDSIRIWTLLSCMILFCGMLVGPTLIYGVGSLEGFATNFLSFHTVTYHNLVLFGLFLIIALRLFKTNTKRDLLTILFGYLSYGIIAGSMAQILKTNFNNFYQSNIPFVENIRLVVVENLGWFGQFLYVCVITFAEMALAYICYGAIKLGCLIYKKIKEKQNKEKTVERQG